MYFKFYSHRIIHKYFRVIAGCAVLIGLVACASGARTGAMVAPVAFNQIIADNSPIKNAITVGAVDGGGETNPLWVSKVSNANFKTALEDSLALSLLKGKADAPYVLNVQLVSLHQPFAGFDMTVTSTVQYKLVAAGQTTPVLNETVVTPYSANFSDAFYAPERLRLANEGAMRENIREIISRIIAAAQPGGALSSSAAAKISLLQ